MPELGVSTIEDDQTSTAYDRPTGQSDPTEVKRPGARIVTNILVISASTVALVCWIAFLLNRDSSNGDQYKIFAVILVFAAGSACFPLQFAYKQEINFEGAVIVLAALLLPPDMAITACVIGYVIGYGIRYSGTIGLDCPYNARPRS